MELTNAPNNVLKSISYCNGSLKFERFYESNNNSYK